MARRRKHHTVRRRRRVGAASGMQGLVMKAAGIGAGVFVGGMVAKTISTLDPKISGGIMLAGGLFLAQKAKSPLLDGIGYGLAAKGANNLLTAFGVINGIGAIPMLGYRNSPKLQNSVGNVMKNPIGAVKDLNTIGALYDN